MVGHNLLKKGILIKRKRRLISFLDLSPLFLVRLIKIPLSQRKIKEIMGSSSRNKFFIKYFFAFFFDSIFNYRYKDPIGLRSFKK